MKTFKELINEVAEPKGEDEKRFKAKHVVKKMGHPVASDAQFQGTKAKDKSKKASYHDGEDEEVYEEAGLTVDEKGRNIERFKKKAKKMTRTKGDAEINTDIADNVTEDADQLDEKHAPKLKPDTAGEALKKSREEGKAKRKRLSSTQRSVQGGRDSAEKMAYDMMRRPKRKRMGEEYIDEAVKAGSMKLKDGSSVRLTKEDAEAMNDLFSELNSSNKKRMEEEMMASKSGFEKILNFAKEAN